MTLGQVTFLARNAGLWLCLVCIWAAMGDIQAPLVYWLGPLLQCMISPWLGRWLASRASDPRHIERWHLVLSHVLGGVWTALIGFNLLPAIVILAILSMHSMTAGGAPALCRGFLAHAAGMALGAWVTGFAWHPVTSQAVLLACLPAVLLQPLIMSTLANRVIRKLEAQREQLRIMASRDALSGLFNRSHWEDAVRREYARAQRAGTPATLVMIDLDHFKRINDEHGHAAGDEVIRGFGALLRACVRECDVAGRYGGEEFGLLLAGSAGAAGLKVVQRVRSVLAATSLHPGVRVAASYGIVELTPQMASPDAWMAEADQRLYAAKHAGRDRIVATSQPVGADPSVGLAPCASAADVADCGQGAVQAGG